MKESATPDKMMNKYLPYLYVFYFLSLGILTSQDISEPSIFTIIVGLFASIHLVSIASGTNQKENNTNEEKETNHS